MPEKILIVEDTPETLELLRRIIEKEGYRTLLATDGEKGVQYALKYNPDLIILDRLLPKLPGLQVCKRLRQVEATKNTPIIFLSVLDSEKDIVDGLKAGGDDYVTKPFSPDELLARIERVLFRYNNIISDKR
jgi:DNA-binding response OmpR family regulator